MAKDTTKKTRWRYLPPEVRAAKVARRDAREADPKYPRRRPATKNRQRGRKAKKDSRAPSAVKAEGEGEDAAGASRPSAKVGGGNDEQQQQQQEPDVKADKDVPATEDTNDSTI